MEKYLVSQFEQYNEKFMSRIHKGFRKQQETNGFSNNEKRTNFIKVIKIEFTQNS